MASLFTRALAGAGKEAGNIASRYIDEDLAARRAQMLADLQVQTAGRMRAEEDAFRNDPTRVARDRENRVADVTAVGQAQNRVALEGERAKATDTVLQGAITKNEVDRRQAAADVDTQAMKDRLPLEVQRAVQIADAQGRTAAKYRERPPTVADKVADIEKVLGRPLTEQEKLGALGMTKGRDPELDTETVTEERMNPDGSVTKIQRKQVRKPGGLGEDGGKAVQVPEAAIAHLRKNPDLAADFDAKYGKGASARVLGDQTAAGDRKPSGSLMDRATKQAPRSTAMDAEIQQAMKPVQGNTSAFAERQANRAKAEADPELQALDRRRAELLRAGKARDANTVIEQMNQLRQERYGF